MTAYVLFGKLKAGNLKLDDRISISQQAWNAKGARLFLRPGSSVRAEDLLKGLTVLSANDAAIALAERVAGSEKKFRRRDERRRARARPQPYRFRECHGS